MSAFEKIMGVLLWAAMTFIFHSLGMPLVVALIAFPLIAAVAVMHHNAETRDSGEPK